MEVGTFVMAKETDKLEYFIVEIDAEKVTGEIMKTTI